VLPKSYLNIAFKEGDLRKVQRLVREYRDLARVLERNDFLALVKATVVHSPEILRTGKLTSVDAAMSRDITVNFGKAPIVVPLAEIDDVLRERNDNPTFGNVREIYARNCYLNGLRLNIPQRTVLDLGANRGIFSILALLALQAELVVGVEPNDWYESIFQMILRSNRCNPVRAPRYARFVSSVSMERQDPGRFISIPTILRENKIDRFNLVKMDIEGGEKEVFSEPEWLARVDTITMELHPRMVGDLSLIPEALKKYGFEFEIIDQAGQPVSIDSGVFLFASCKGALGS
jgi:hypothetical protein